MGGYKKPSSCSFELHDPRQGSSTVVKIVIIVVVSSINSRYPAVVYFYMSALLVPSSPAPRYSHFDVNDY